jgi:hypothetical protein
MYDVLGNTCINTAHFWFLGMAKLPTVKLLKASRTDSLHVTVRFNYVWVNSSLYNDQIPTYYRGKSAATLLQPCKAGNKKALHFKTGVLAASL